MQRMYDQSHQTLSMTCNCPIPLGQNKIYNIKGRLQGTKGWRWKTTLEEESNSTCSGPASGLSLPSPAGTLWVSFASPALGNIPFIDISI